MNVHFARFGRNAASLRAPNGSALSYEQIATAAPTVFADKPHESRSARFVHIPTADLLSGMAAEGFLPVAVKVGGSRDAEKRNFTKHMIRFRRHDTLEMRMDKVGDTVPELILVNAHDGTSSYQLQAGLFRLACLNGLVVCDSTVSSLKIGHRGNAMDKVIEGSYTVLNDAARALPRAEAMTQITVDAPEAEAFARSALALRFDANELAARKPIVNDILRARRLADNGNSLWQVFNRTQESLLRGGFRYVTETARGEKQIRHARPVNAVSDDLRLNAALWQLAESMAALKGQPIAA